MNKKQVPASPFPSFSDMHEEVELNDDEGCVNNSSSARREISSNRSRSLDDAAISTAKDWPTLKLERENERLRAELALMRKRFRCVKAKQKEQQRPHHPSRQKRMRLHRRSSSKTAVLLELPAMMLNSSYANGNNSNNMQGLLNCVSSKADDAKPRKTRNGNIGSNSEFEKDHQSLTPAVERSRLESQIDLEAHQSGAGLYHRAHHFNAAIKNRIHRFDKTSNRTLKTSLTTDDSSSSSNSDEEEELESLAEGRSLVEMSRQNNSESAAVQAPNHWERTQLPFCEFVADRAGWLVGLLVFQSLSSFILARNESLLQRHAVIVQFLTMLVGAGGNAGNQASVGVVRGLAVGTIDRSNVSRFLRRELAMGLALSIILGIAGFLRAAVFAIPWLETIAITSSLFMIVMISVVAGALLPLGMYLVGIDPAHSSTTIQVIMDITGVVITVQVSSLVLDTEFRQWLEQILSMDGEVR